MSSKLRRTYNQRMARKVDKPEVTPGLLGDGAGIVAVPGRANYVYVRLAGGGLAQVYNTRAPAQNDLPVICGYDLSDPGRYQVLGVQSAVAESAGYEFGGTGYAPANRYRYMAPGGGQDVLWVEGQQVMPGRVIPAGGLKIYVYPCYIYTGSAWAQIGGATQIDLTSLVPATSGQACMVLVTISTSGSVVTTAGTAAAIADLGADDIPAIPANTRLVLGAVRLYNGQSEIYEGRSNTDLVDLRWFARHTHTAGEVSGLSGSHTHTESDITDLEHTDPNALHLTTAQEISTLTEKTALADNDLFLVEDSENGYAKRKFKKSNLPSGSGGGAPTDAQYVVIAANSTLTAERVLTAGDGITITDGGAGNAVTVSQKTIGARVYKTSNQSINNDSETAVTFDSESFDTDTIHDTSTNTSRLTCKTAGIYLIVGFIRWGDNSTGRRQVRIKKNGTDVIATDRRSGLGYTGQPITAIASLSVNDYVEMVAYQDSGSALNIYYASGEPATFSMMKIGSV